MLEQRDLKPPKLKILGALEPFSDIGKDFILTFKPYKLDDTNRDYHILWDLAQPFRGLGNLVKGLGGFIVALIMWVPPIMFITSAYEWLMQNVRPPVSTPSATLPKKESYWKIFQKQAIFSAFFYATDHYDLHKKEEYLPW